MYRIFALCPCASAILTGLTLAEADDFARQFVREYEEALATVDSELTGESVAAYSSPKRSCPRLPNPSPFVRHTRPLPGTTRIRNVDDDINR